MGRARAGRGARPAKGGKNPEERDENGREGTKGQRIEQCPVWVEVESTFKKKGEKRGNTHKKELFQCSFSGSDTRNEGEI